MNMLVCSIRCNLGGGMIFTTYFTKKQPKTQRGNDMKHFNRLFAVTMLMVISLFSISNNAFAEDIVNLSLNTPHQVNIPPGVMINDPNEEILRLDVNAISEVQLITELYLTFSSSSNVPWDAIELRYQDVVLSSVETGWQEDGLWIYHFPAMGYLFHSPVEDDFFTISVVAMNISLSMPVYNMMVTVPLMEVLDVTNGTHFTDIETPVTYLNVQEAHVNFTSYVGGYYSGDQCYWLLPGEMLYHSFHVYPYIYNEEQIETLNYASALWPFGNWEMANYLAPDTTRLANHGSLMVNNSGSEIGMSWFGYNTLVGGFSLGGFEIYNNDLPVGQDVTIGSHADVTLTDINGNDVFEHVVNTRTIFTVDGILGDVNGDQIVNIDDAFLLQDIITYYRQADWNEYTETGCNTGRGEIFFNDYTLLDAQAIWQYAVDPEHPSIQGLGIGNWMSENMMNSTIQSTSYEVELDDQLITIWTDGNAVMVKAMLSDDTIWKDATRTSNGQAIFQIPDGVSVEDITVEAVSITGSEVVDMEQRLIPDAFTLSQNYPNPFNPTTTINFDLPTAGQVNLSVYNMNGQLVNTLIDSKMNAGQNVANFDASNLSSGVYFYTLTANESTETRKMILMK